METFELVEHNIIAAVQWLRLGVEALGALTIALGVLIAAYLFVRSLILPRHADFNAIRLTLARYLVLALEFQLAADILSTAITPDWNQIGKLGVIAIIRTALNYFLEKEMEKERQREPSGEQPDIAATEN